MGNPEEGWQLMGRGSRVQLDERQVIETWIDPRKPETWSGCGKHADACEFERLEKRFSLKNFLGKGTFGKVEDVEYVCSQHHSVRLARKRIERPPKVPLDRLLREGEVMEKLNRCQHVVKFVGSYTRRRGQTEFVYLLSWPVASCTLDQFLGCIDTLRHQPDIGDVKDAQKRLKDMGLNWEVLSSDEAPSTQYQLPTRKYPLDYLGSVLGCIANALAFCHSNDIRHRDLKPENILLDSGNIYLTDFGISLDVAKLDSTMIDDTSGTPKWCAPEMFGQPEHSARKAEIYSLGLIFLKAATVLYGRKLEGFEETVRLKYGWRYIPPNRPQTILGYAEGLRADALATQLVRDENDITCGPRHIIGLVTNMLDPNPDNRPTAEQVSTALTELGGIDQVYMGCQGCRKSTRFIVDLVDKRQKAESHQLRDKLERATADLASAESRRNEDIERAKAEATSRLKAEADTLRSKLDSKAADNERLAAENERLAKRAADLEGAMKVLDSRQDKEMQKLKDTAWLYQEKFQEAQAEITALKRSQPGRRRPQPHPGFNGGGGRNRPRKQSDASSSQQSRPRSVTHQISMAVHSPVLADTPTRPADQKRISYSNAVRGGRSPAPSGPTQAIASSLTTAIPTPTHPSRPSPMTPYSAGPTAATVRRSPRPDGVSPGAADMTRTGSSSKLPRLVNTGLATPVQSRSCTPMGAGPGLSMSRHGSHASMIRSPGNGDITQSSTQGTSYFPAYGRLRDSLDLGQARNSPRTSQTDLEAIPTRIPNPSPKPTSTNIIPAHNSSFDSGVDLEKPRETTKGENSHFLHAEPPRTDNAPHYIDLAPPRRRSPSTASQVRSVISDVSVGSKKSYRDAVLHPKHLKLPDPTPSSAIQSPLSSPRTAPSDVLSMDNEAFAPPAKVPSLTTQKSWAAVVGTGAGVAKMLAVNSKPATKK